MESIETLVTKLQKANWAYHNGDTQVMSDDQYDVGLEELKKRCPTHPFLRVIGAPVSKGGVMLPVILGSLDKMRYGEGVLERWMSKQKTKEFIVSEKLDGLSSLYICDGKGKKMLYLRGDGVRGVDISRATSNMNFPPHKCMIRGELVLPLTSTPEGSIGRSLVNGWMHRVLDKKNSIPEEIKEIHFVGYEIYEPEGIRRDEQFEWLKKRGFRIPWVKEGSKKDLTEEKLKEYLIERKKESKYPLDGLVVGVKDVPQKVVGGEAKNPEDLVAFKAALDEQRKESTVIQVEWNASRQGILIPRIQIEPIEISGATIQWISGHNAGIIEEGCIGPGAKVLVRRSGDVIPMIEKVLERSLSGLPQMPDEGKWEWDERHVHAVMKKDNSQEDLTNLVNVCIHSLQTLGVDGIGPGLVKKIVESGFKTIESLWKAKEEDLTKILGPTRGKAFQQNLKESFKKATQGTLLIASNELPRGIGEKKLRILYELEKDARKWKDVIREVPVGWTDETYSKLLETLPKAFEWIERTFGNETLNFIENKELVDKKKVTNGNVIVFTGVRDKDLEGEYEKKGWVIGDSVNKKTTILVISNEAKGETVKTKKAKELGIKILTLNECKDFLNEIR